MTAGRGGMQLPEGVVALLERAVRADALDSVDSMALALTETGWVRGLRSGSWSFAADPAWSIESAGRPPSLSVFVRGGDGEQAQASASLHELLDSGGSGPLRRSETVLGWSTWFGGGVEVSLVLSPRRQRSPWSVPAMMQLAVERADASPDGPAPDPHHARLTASEGSPIARWYLAGESHLPADVVDRLAGDDDSSVSAAWELNEEHRRLGESPD